MKRASISERLFEVRKPEKTLLPVESMQEPEREWLVYRAITRAGVVSLQRHIGQGNEQFHTGSVF